MNLEAIRWNNPGTERQIQHDFSYLYVDSKGVTLIEAEQKVAETKVYRSWGRYCSKNIKFQLGVIS